MGVLNVTPDSFSDGGDFTQADSASQRALQMAAQGAHIIDIGGMSTRPGSDPIPETAELSRVLPVIRAIRDSNTDVVLSIDTYRSQVGLKAVQAGADIINDVSGGSLDPEMLRIMAQAQVPVVLMHMRGTPKTMAGLNDYAGGDVIADVIRTLGTTVQEAIKAGIRRWNIIVDPGIGTTFVSLSCKSMLTNTRIREKHRTKL
jgi:dihydroneopterin aldolase/2-amino-4-hydroxy-6-hydroxymethyldihydropteridine diphosphokinase/dihydropteroate synthase/2-amino-4-hydroxy-6-hydroxymethyldihydropteridine diphosphokinase/dihydropteroate synthase